MPRAPAPPGACACLAESKQDVAVCLGERVTHLRFTATVPVCA
jgi:hypothetical protein